MEGMNKAKIDHGLPPLPKSQTHSVPLAPSSFHEWNNHHFMNYDGGKPYCPHSDAKTFHLPNDDNKTAQNPSPPSDMNPIPGGDNFVKSTESETTAGDQTREARHTEHDMDPRKLRRIMSNRVSAQKSRMKKLQYVTDMEKKAKALEAQIAILHPQVALYRNKQESLEREQQSLNQRVITYTNNSILINAEIEENKAEVNRLRQLHLSQQQKMQGHIMLPVWESGMDEIMNSSLHQTGLGQVVYANPNQGPYLENPEEMLQKQLKMKYTTAESVDGKEEPHMLDQLNMNQQQQNPRHDMLMMPSWEIWVGQMPNTSLNIQSGPQQKASMINSNLGGIERILSMNNNNVSQDPSNGFI